MAIPQQKQDQNPCILDALYCEEQHFQDDDEENPENYKNVVYTTDFFEQEMLLDDEELQSLLDKEKEGIFNEISMVSARKDAVEWMLKVNSLYGFCALTSILSVNYFDRCISSMNFVQFANKPWTVQLAAVACVSLAAKVEETDVPLLLDLQVEGTSPIFEPRDIQKMELLLLSTREWKMHPVTPLSFLNHIIKRLGFNHHLHLEFLRKCEEILLSLLSDWRFMSYLPSVLATATMMHVIDRIESCNNLEYHNQLLNVFNTSKEKVNDCYDLIVERSTGSTKNNLPNFKRKFEQISMNIKNNEAKIPSSPNGVVDAYYFISDSSNDSCVAIGTTNLAGKLSSAASSSPAIRWKKGRVYEQPMPLQLPTLSRVFMDKVESPR